jgi:hypothetical protein
MISLNEQKKTWRLMAGTLLAFFVMTVCPGTSWVPAAMATARQDLDRAQDLYDFAEFQQALELVTGLVDGGQLVGDNLRDAYILRARCAVGLGLEKMAQDDFCSVMNLDKNWAPDPVVYPKDEVALFNASRGNCALETAKAEPADSSGGKPWFKKPVAWVVGGVVLIGGAALALGGGGDDDTPADPALPGFPATP